MISPLRKKLNWWKLEKIGEEISRRHVPFGRIQRWGQLAIFSKELIPVSYKLRKNNLRAAIAGLFHWTNNRHALYKTIPYSQRATHSSSSFPPLRNIGKIKAMHCGLGRNNPYTSSLKASLQSSNKEPPVYGWIRLPHALCVKGGREGGTCEMVMMKPILPSSPQHW